jgi:hypothetical protein
MLARIGVVFADFCVVELCKDCVVEIEEASALNFLEVAKLCALRSRKLS